MSWSWQTEHSSLFINSIWDAGSPFNQHSPFPFTSTKFSSTSQGNSFLILLSFRKNTKLFPYSWWFGKSFIVLTCTHCFIYLSVAVLTLCCSMQAFSSCGERGLLSRGGAPVSPCSGFSCCGSWALDARASVAAAPGLRRLGPPACCSGARGIFPDQEDVPCLGRKILSHLSHQGSPVSQHFKIKFLFLSTFRKIF